MSHILSESDRDVFPPEIIGHIIDIVGKREREVYLTPQQCSTLKACALVCKAFLPLSRTHLLRYASFGLDGGPRQKRLNQLVQLLKDNPNIKYYIRELVVDLPEYITPVEDESSTRNTMSCILDVLTDIPAVESITICYSSRAPRRLSSVSPVGSFCHRIIEVYAERGTLRAINVKKMEELPYTIIFATTVLHTLCLDRCDLPILTEPIPSIKSLTLRKIVFIVRFLSFFPNIEELHIICTNVVKCAEFPYNLPPPSFGIRALTLEHGSRMSYMDSAGDRASISILLEYFYAKAEQEGVPPFSRLKTLGILLSPDFPAIARLFKDAPIQSLVYSAFPPRVLKMSTVVNYMRNSHYPISLRCTTELPLCLPGSVTIPITSLAWGIVSISVFESIECSHILERPAFSTIHWAGCAPDHPVLELWTKFISALMKTRPGFAEIEEIEIFMIFGSKTQEVIIDRDAMTDEIADAIANRTGALTGTCFNDFDGTQWRKARLSFLVHDY